MDDATCARGWGGGAAFAGALFLTLASSPAARAAAPPSDGDLNQLSIEDLGNIEVSSVSKTSERLSDAPAAVYVITSDQIARSGAQSIPEILRLAPNLHVVRTAANRYFVTARGLIGNPGAQNFSNKLLVLIDGRSVYTPLYSGVQWDVQAVAPDDIERIEVISGPGATLWGANAVNGVVNIITRASRETAGFLADASGGNQESTFGVRYGGRFNDALTYRVYVRNHRDANSVTGAGADVRDGAHQTQGGFRLDWTASADDVVTLQGDTYDGATRQPVTGSEDTNGRNLLGRWTHNWQDGSTLQLQAYYDRTERTTAGTGVRLSIYDVDAQYNFSLGARNRVVVGAGYRSQPYRILGSQTLSFAPPGRTLNLSNAFIQNTLSLTSNLTLVVGLKLEDDPYSGLATLPNARLSWKVNESTLLWGAVSKAVRAPTPFDRDVREELGGVLFLTGGADFRPEKLTAYEAGLRIQPTEAFSLSVSGFYNEYRDLRTIEFHPTTLIPLHWGNEMFGKTYGVEVWADYRVAPWWRMSLSYNDLVKQLKFRPGASGILGTAQAGDDPRYRASLRSSMNLGPAVTLDGTLRYVSALPDPRVPAYTEFDGRIGWAINDQVQLSVSGFNLLHKRHLEFPADFANAVPRSFVVGLRWRY